MKTHNSGEGPQRELSNSRTLSVGMISNKYHVNHKVIKLQAENEQVDCPGYNEIESKLAVTKSLSCDEVIQKGITLSSLCIDALDELGGEDLATTRPTGRTYNVCKQRERGRGNQH